MLWLGIDVGTSGLKALLVNEEGEVEASYTVEYGMSTPQPGWAEQEPESWWQALVKALAQLRSQIPELKDRLQGIGLTGQMHSSVFLDENFQVIRPAILWCDQRTADECEEITERIGFERLVELTLNRALSGFTLPKLLWLRNKEPENYARLKHLLVCKDYIRFRLTRQLATEVSDASGTLMFEVRNRSWSQELIQELGINPEILPTCYESTEITGELTSVSAEELGLKPGVPLEIDTVIPAPGQGVIAIETRDDDEYMQALFKGIDHGATRLCSETERTFLRALGADCNFPVAAHAFIVSGDIILHGMIGDIDRPYLMVRKTIRGRDTSLGRILAEKLLVELEKS